MSSLQIIMACIWGGIALGIIYSVGEALGGSKGGRDAVVAIFVWLLSWAA